MTNEEAIQIIRDEIDFLEEEYENEAQDFIKALRLAISAFSRDRWISVEERLPDVHTHVLVNIPGESPFPTVKEAFLKKNGLWYSNGFRYNPEEVTHWMPLPEPPKEDKQE